MTKKRTKGKLIVLDGLDGSGKATQTGLLIKRLKKEGYKTAVTDFPQYYTTFFGKMTARYLRGEFGTAKQVSPYFASLLFAGDRWQAKDKIQRWLDEGKIVISNRYVSANQIHQASKIRGAKKKKEFLIWLSELEYKVFGIPRPDMVVFLYVPFQIGKKLVSQKAKRQYIGRKKRDIHERSHAHLSAAEKQVLQLVRESSEWQQIDCVKKEKLLSRQAIHELVWSSVRKKI